MNIRKEDLRLLIGKLIHYKLLCDALVLNADPLLQSLQYPFLQDSKQLLKSSFILLKDGIGENMFYSDKDYNVTFNPEEDSISIVINKTKTEIIIKNES